MKHLFLLLLLLASCRKPTPEAPPAEAHDEAPHDDAHAVGVARTVKIDPEMLRDLRITTAEVESRPGGEGVTVLGEIRVGQDAYAEVGSAIPARILKVLVRAGDKVTAGQALVELQSVELGKARAAYLAAKARAELTRKTAERKRGLAADKIISEGELQAVEAEAMAAAAEVKAAKSSLTALGASPQELETEGDSSKLVLRSPIAGVVIDRDASLGQVAGPSKALLKIGELSALSLVVHAFERDAVRVKPGTVARVILPALPGRGFEATVAAVGQQVELASRTIAVRLELPNPQGLLRPGMSASAFIPIGAGEANIVSVPAAALQRANDGWLVFTPQREGVFELREVGRGRDLGGEVEILSGLQPGEAVVVEGAFLLKAELEKSRGEGDHHAH